MTAGDVQLSPPPPPPPPPPSDERRNETVLRRFIRDKERNIGFEIEFVYFASGRFDRCEIRFRDNVETWCDDEKDKWAALHCASRQLVEKWYAYCDEKPDCGRGRMMLHDARDLYETCSKFVEY